MRITTIEEARQLVGRTFERNGKRRTVQNVRNDNGVWGVFFHDGNPEKLNYRPLKYFLDWLSGAKEITDA